MSGRIVEYKSLFGALPTVLERQVNKLLGEGWKLYGTPYSCNNKEGIPYFCQAMVREEAARREVDG